MAYSAGSSPGSVILAMSLNLYNGDTPQDEVVSKCNSQSRRFRIANLRNRAFQKTGVGLEASRSGRGYDDRDARRTGVAGASPRAAHHAGASGEAGLGAAPTPGSVLLTGRARPSVLGGGGAGAPRREAP